MKNQNLNRLILGFLLVGLFLLFFLPPTDPDLGWHLRCGQQFWEQGKLCAQNTFSVLMADYYWPDARTFYQGSIFPFYKIFNLFGLSMVNSFLLLATFVLWLSLSGKREIKATLMPLIIFLSWSVLGFGIRNQLISLFFLFALIKTIELTEKNQKWAFLFPLIMFFWANSHGGFVLGVFLLSIFLFEKTLRLLTRPHQDKNYLFFLIPVLLSLGATLLNPFGIKIYFEGWRHLMIVPLSQLIAEWVPPQPWLQITILIFLGLTLGVLYQNRKQPLTLLKTITLIFLALLALRARRDLAFFFFLAGYLFSSLKIKTKIFPSLALLAAAFIFVLGFFFQLPRTMMIDGSWDQFCQIRYACEGVSFLKERPEKGNIFNTYEQGGFLIWQLPEYKVFIDGRMPAWPHPSGKSPYTIYLETLQTQPGWQETLQDYDINWLFIGPGTFMDLKIRDDPQSLGWQEVFRGKRAVIYQKI